MAGYTRQATANIVTGAVIDAADFNSEYNAIEAAFNASTGHAHDGTTGNGPPIENVGPSQDLVVTSSVVRPKVDNTYDFGTASIEWKDGFFDGTLRTDVLTVDETSTLTGNVTASADVSVGGNLTVTGNATINGNLTFGDADTDTVSFGADIDSHIIPDDDDTFDLGSSTKQWRNLYIDGVAEIDGLNADTADINGGTIDGTVIGGNVAAAVTATTINASGGITGDVTGDLTGDVTGNVSGSAGSCTGNAATATKLATARAIAVSGAVTGTANFDGSAGITISTTATSDPQLTLQGDVTGSATFTNLGNATLSASLSANSVGSSEIANNAVGSTEIADDAVTSAKIAAGAVDSTALGTDAVTTSKIADNAITAALIATNAVGSSEIAANAVGASEIAANAVGSSEIAASAVGASELNVSGDGTNTQFLRSDGDGSFSWATPAGQTLTGGTSISISGSAINLDPDQRHAATVDVVVGNQDEYITFDKDDEAIKFRAGGTIEMMLESDGDLHVDGDVIGFSTSVSDKRLKHDIEKIDSALDKVSELNGYTFSYNKNGKRAAGVIAQEVEKVLPSAVENKSLVFHTGEEGVEYKTVKYDQLHGLLIEAIKELKQKLDECKCKKCECE